MIAPEAYLYEVDGWTHREARINRRVPLPEGWSESPLFLTPPVPYLPPVDDDGSIRRRWLTVQVPGRIAEKKGPFKSYDSTVDFALRLYDSHPAGTLVTMLELTWDFDLWVSPGNDLVFMEACGRLARLKAPEQRALRSLQPHRDWQGYGKVGKPNKAFHNLPRPEVVVLDDTYHARLTTLGVAMCSMLRSSADIKATVNSG